MLCATAVLDVGVPAVGLDHVLPLYILMTEFAGVYQDLCHHLQK